MMLLTYSVLIYSYKPYLDTLMSFRSSHRISALQMNINHVLIEVLCTISSKKELKALQRYLPQHYINCINRYK